VRLASTYLKFSWWKTLLLLFDLKLLLTLGLSVTLKDVADHVFEPLKELQLNLHHCLKLVLHI
jgi:hypothetical protein